MNTSSPDDYMIQVSKDEKCWLELLESMTTVPIDIYIHSLISTDLRQAMAHHEKQFRMPLQVENWDTKVPF